MFNFLFFLSILLLAFLFFVWGFKLRQGKWLRSIAGNTFNELSKEKAEKIGKNTGIILYFSALFCILVGIAPFSGPKYQFFILFLIGTVMILSLFAIVYALSDWIKNG